MARSYVALKTRVDQLEASLLPTRPNTGNFTRKEEDLIRSYVLLVHAEIESFCEELVLYVVNECERRSTPTRCYGLISRLVLFRAAGGSSKEYDLLDQKTIEEACENYRSLVKKNNGVKRGNVLQLFLPIGLNHHDFDESFLANLDAFGTRRGDFAHQSFRTDGTLDPATEKSRIALILPEIARIDQLTRALIRST